jgi:hypothetical protein
MESCLGRILISMTKPSSSDRVQTLVTATLAVRDWPRAMELYKRAFNAVETYRVPGGGVGRLSVEGAEFWVAEESPDWEVGRPWSSSSKAFLGRDRRTMPL